jgi:hypothetical protein
MPYLNINRLNNIVITNHLLLKMKNLYFTSFTDMRIISASLVIIFCLSFHSMLTAQDLAISFNRAATGVDIARDNAQQLNLSFTFSGITTFGVESEKGLFNEILIPGTYAIGALGTPKLPASKHLIEIPFGADVHVKVKNYSVTEYVLADYGIEHQLMPVQPSLRKDMDPMDVKFEFDADLYTKDAFVTHEIAQVEVLGVMRSYRIARLTVAPVSYNPVSGIIRVFNDIEVEISYTNVDMALTNHIKASTYSPYFEAVRSSFLNNPFRDDYPDHPDLTAYPVHYLVVSDRMFEDALQPFLAWKTQKGFFLTVAYTDEIGTSYGQIQAYIHSQYNNATPENPAPSFVLLVGDTPQIPATIGTSSGKMTDLYYASVDGDYFPEMYYGRFSANNPSQLIPQIEKTLYYERYEFDDPSFLDKSTLIAGADGTWNPRVGQPTIHYATQNYWNEAHGYTDVFAYLTSPYTGCYSPEKIAVSYINYTAHCNQNVWGDPSLTIAQVNAFVNAGQYPLAIGNCCLSADFGYPECIGEAFVRAPNKGAVAYIGSSPNSYWFEDFYWAVGAFPIQGTNNGYVPTFEETTLGAYDGPFVSDYVSASGIVFVGNLAVTEVDIQGYPSHSSPLYYWQAYNVLGDPSIITYNTQGAPNDVTHMPIVPIGLDYYEVEAIPGSYVAISKDGVLHGAALVDASGQVEVPLEPVLSSGMVDIVVTRPQTIPYMTQVPAAALEGPYVVLDSYEVNDASGNNNGLADYGESISLHITLKNVGADPSADAMVTVTGSDPYISLTGTNTQNFGPIINGQTATVENAFSFIIENYLPNQHQATFVLEITDGSDTWYSNLRIVLYAPLLQILAEVVIDDTEFGNGDGILDPGETAMAMLTLKNAGGSAINDIIATLTSGDALLTVDTESVTIDLLNGGSTIAMAFSVTADASSPIGYPVYLNAVATGGPENLYSANQNVMIVIGLIPEFYMTNGTVTTCVGLFYDSGGPDGEYGNNENFTMTFLPSIEESMIKANFLSFNTEAGYDRLFIYNGTNATAPQFPGSPFDGTTSPGMIIASNPAGALTFRFTSDGSVTRPGWEAEISCHIIDGPPSCATNPFPANGAQNAGVASILSWSALDATLFDVYFGLTDNPPMVATIENTFYTPVLQPNTTYYWKVVPKNSHGSASGCPVWSFTTTGPQYLMTNGTFVVNNGMFYDSGGPNGEYGNNENLTMTFIPAVEGYKLKFNFQQFSTESGYDFLYIYNGPNTSAPQFAGSPFHGTAGPGTVVSTHETGAITFRFTSDVSVTRPGWAAAFMLDGALSVNPVATPQEICEGGAAQLNANAAGGSGNYTCVWEPATSLSNPTAPNPIATPASTTMYTVTVNDGVNIVTGEILLEVHAVATIELGNDTILCAPFDMQLDASIPNGVSYYWQPHGQTTAIITVDSTGVGYGTKDYHVTVIDENGCVVEAGIRVTFDPCTFIEARQENIRVAIYPNPTQSLFNLNLSGNSNHIAYSLLNYQGQVLQAKSLGKLNGTMHQTIDVSSYPKGIYYIRINTDKDVLVSKIVIN